MFAHIATTPKCPAFPQEKRARFCLFVKSCSYLFAAWFPYWAQGLKCQPGTGMKHLKHVPADSAQARGSSTAWAQLEQDLLQAGFGHLPGTARRKLGLRHRGPEASCLTYWTWPVSFKKWLSVAGCINVNNPREWSGGHLTVCTYPAAFSEEPRWLQGFRERRKTNPLPKNECYSILHTPEGTLRLGNNYCCPFLPPLLSASPCKTEMLQESSKALPVNWARSWCPVQVLRRWGKWRTEQCVFSGNKPRFVKGYFILRGYTVGIAQLCVYWTSAGDKNTWPCPCPPFSPKRQPHNQKVRDDPGHQPILAPMQELDRTWKKTWQSQEHPTLIFLFCPDVAKVAETKTGPRAQNRKYFIWDM